MRTLKVKNRSSVSPHFTGIIEFPTGTRMWIENNELHRLDGPAIEWHWSPNGKSFEYRILDEFLSEVQFKRFQIRWNNTSKEKTKELMRTFVKLERDSEMQITEEIKKLAVRNNKNSGIPQAYREMKKVEAEARAEARSKLTPAQQMDVLNSKLGNGKGAKKERARLLREMKEMGYRQETIDKYRFAGRDAYVIELPIANNPGIGNHEKRIEKFQKRSK